MKTAADLREARRKTGLSIAECSRLSGTPYDTWQGWESEGTTRSRRPPPIAFSWLDQYSQLHPSGSPAPE